MLSISPAYRPEMSEVSGTLGRLVRKLVGVPFTAALIVSSRMRVCPAVMLGMVTSYRVRWIL
jgi:hypothetical protein